jgi:hypothetical protein
MVGGIDFLKFPAFLTRDKVPYRTYLNPREVWAFYSVVCRPIRGLCWHRFWQSGEPDFRAPTIAGPSRAGQETSNF